MNLDTRMRILKAYFSELFLALKYLPLFRYLYREFKSGGSLNREDREMVHTALKLPIRLMQGKSHKVFQVYRGFAGEAFSAPYLSDVETIYINGIMTNESQAKREAQLMANMLKLPVTLMHNNSNGFFTDIYDCIRMRIRNKSDEDSRHLRQTIEEGYRSGKRHFVLIGYSQGSIIVCHAMDTLSKEVLDNCHFTVLTFGSAQDELKAYPNGTARHVAHHRDYVARTGVLHHAKSGKVHGRVLRVSGDTHSLVPYVRTMQDKLIPEEIHQAIQLVNKK